MKNLLAALTATACLCAGTASAAMVDITPTSQTAGSGSLLTVDLNVSGLGNGTALGAFDISVNFDSALLSFQSATFGDPVLGDQLDLGDLGLNGPTATPGTGTADLIETDLFDSPSTLLEDQAGSFTLAVLTFDAMATGTSPLSLTINSLADQNSSPFTASTRGAAVAVSPVPLPGAALLLASGLGVIGAALRRRREAP